MGVDGVRDDDVEVEGGIEEPLEGGEEEVVKTHGERVAQQLKADDAEAPYYRPERISDPNNNSGFMCFQVSSRLNVGS